VAMEVRVSVPRGVSAGGLAGCAMTRGCVRWRRPCGADVPWAAWPGPRLCAGMSGVWLVAVIGMALLGLAVLTWVPLCPGALCAEDACA